jgi:hypothetical protein
MVMDRVIDNGIDENMILNYQENVGIKAVLTFLKTGFTEDFDLYGY